MKCGEVRLSQGMGVVAHRTHTAYGRLTVEHMGFRRPRVQHPFEHAKQLNQPG